MRTVTHGAKLLSPNQQCQSTERKTKASCQVKCLEGIENITMRFINTAIQSNQTFPKGSNIARSISSVML